MAQRVLKFGGAALADGPAVRRVCRIVAREWREAQDPPLVVVSAHRGVTDLLEQVARAAASGRLEGERVRIRHRSLLAQLALPSELLDRFWRELDAMLAHVRGRGRLDPGDLDLALSFGERLSARVVARTLASQGVPATPVDAWDLGFVTDSNHGRAQPLDGIEAAIRPALAQIEGVAVVTGFLAEDTLGRRTTLGRDGSDLTAAVIAEALGADEVQYWKPVPGLLSADPALVPDAYVLPEVTYAEAAALALHGARVLHPSAIEPARRAGIRVRVGYVAEPESSGTLILPELPRSGPVALASRAELARVDLAVPAPEQRGERSARLFDVLETCGVTPGLVDAGGQRVGVYVEPSPGLPAALAELGRDARLVRDLASLAVIGRGVASEPALGRRVLTLLEDAGLAVQGAFLGLGADAQAFVVRAAELRAAAGVLHAGVLAPPAPAPS